MKHQGRPGTRRQLAAQQIRGDRRPDSRIVGGDRAILQQVDEFGGGVAVNILGHKVHELGHISSYNLELQPRSGHSDCYKTAINERDQNLFLAIPVMVTYGDPIWFDGRS
ncbi:hypothetical protein ES708_13368 [subsurface metagenome]